ncbi:MAG: cobalt ECF transporter T component CbiQ [Candidatus Promineifilaceae bacterium]
MHASTFDRYLYRSSPIHRLDPRVKVVVTLVFIVANVLLPDGSWLAFGLAWLLVLAATVLAHIQPLYVVKRSFVVIPFLLAAVTVIFTLPGNTIASWQVGSRTLTVSDAGLIRFVSIVIRSWVSLQMAILLTAVTQFPDLMHALHHLRVPKILTTIISFMYRYLFVLSDEAMRLIRAREARSAVGKNGRAGGSLLWRAQTAGSMVGQLMLRSFERSERVYAAMLARGYRGEMHTMNPHVMTTNDWLWGAGSVVLILSIQLIARL